LRFCLGLALIVIVLTLFPTIAVFTVICHHAWLAC
jgi:hypothetical protein